MDFLDDIVLSKEIKNQIYIAIEATVKRDELPENFLFLGNDDRKARRIAGRIAEEMNMEFVDINRTIYSFGEFAKEIINSPEESMIFVDFYFIRYANVAPGLLHYLSTGDILFDIKGRLFNYAAPYRFLIIYVNKAQYDYKYLKECFTYVFDISAFGYEEKMQTLQKFLKEYPEIGINEDDAENLLDVDESEVDMNRRLKLLFNKALVNGKKQIEIE